MAKATTKTASLRSRSIRALIIEHSDPDVKLWLRELERAGYAVAADVVDDLPLCAEKIRNNSYDVILADYNLKTFTGMDAFHELAKSGKETPFILVTGTIGEEAAVDCIKLGVSDYVIKDRLARLPVAVARALETRALAEQQEQTARSLWTRDATLGLLFAQLPAVVWTTGADLKVQSLNGMGLPRMGWTPEQVLGHSLLEIYRTEDRDFPAVAAHRRALLGQSAAYEHIYAGRFFSVRIEPLRDPLGNSSGCISLALDVTESRKAQEALQESEERYRVVAETALDAIISIDEQSRVLFANQAVEKIFGYAPSELCGQDVTILMPDYLQVVHRAAIREYVETGKRHVSWEGVQLPGLHKSGREIPLEVSFGESHSGGNHTFTGILRDVTERKIAERQLQETNQTLQALIASSPVAIIPTDCDRNVTLWNPGAEQLYGWTSEEVVGRPYPMIPEARREDVRNNLNRILHGLVISGSEVQHLRKDGSIVEVSVCAGPLRDATGEITGVMAVVTDITQRKQGEAKMLRLTTAVEQSAESVIICDAAGIIQYVNPAFTTITGYTREDVIGQSSRLLRSDKHSSDFYQQLLATIRKGDTWRGEIINRRKDGRRIVAELVITPVRGENGEIIEFIGIHNDVTERRALERQLVQAQKQEAIGQLAGGIAHDFNNVLGAILGMAELGMTEVSEGSKILERLEKIRHHAGRAAALTRQLATFARRQVIELRDINLNDPVKEVISLLGETLGTDIELHTALGSDLSVTRADPGQVEQIILNLCLNARDAMPHGGRLSIETDSVCLDEQYCRLHASARAVPYVRLTVTDTGTGMDPQTVEHIFEPFFTTKDPGLGTGLGLATAYSIVKQHDGFIQVYSEPGEGTIFRIYFPVTASAAPAAAAAAPPELAVRGGHETILVADDHDGMRDLLAESLHALGYRVLLAMDGEGAVQEFTAHRDEIDLAILDVVMPKLRGPDAYRQMAALRPELPVIFCTGYSSDGPQIDSAKAEIATILQKPYTVKSLAQQVRKTLDSVAGRRVLPAPAPPPVRH